MFLLYWEVYVLMQFVLNLRNEHLYWFSGKRTFIDGGVYIRFSGVVGSRVASSLFTWYCIFMWTPNVSSCIRVPKYSRGNEPVKFVVSKQYHQKNKNKIRK